MPTMLLAGFGGQGIQFAGKQLAKTGMHAGKQVSYLSSYGPEMRGGTSNCSVNIEDEPIGSPLVTNPEILMVMNLPSFEKFEQRVVKGGVMFVDSTLISAKTARTDITAHYIPSTQLANDNDFAGLANVIMLGYMMKITGLFTPDFFEECLVASTPKSKPELAKRNAAAFRLGFGYSE